MTKGKMLREIADARKPRARKSMEDALYSLAISKAEGVAYKGQYSCVVEFVRLSQDDKEMGSALDKISSAVSAVITRLAAEEITAKLCDGMSDDHFVYWLELSW